MILRASATNDAARRAGRQAFTLVELLLVLAILGIVTAVTMPSFVRSIRGNRLRTGARSVVMLGRYARSMAVLRQQDMLVTLNLDTGAMSVRATAVLQRPVETDTDATDDADEGSIVFGGDDFGQPEPEPAPQASGSELDRRLDQVDIVSVVIGEEQAFAEGSCSIRYRTNGTCDPYTVTLADSQGATVKVTVDRLSSARTDDE